MTMTKCSLYLLEIREVVVEKEVANENARERPYTRILNRCHSFANNTENKGKRKKGTRVRAQR